MCVHADATKQRNCVCANDSQQEYDYLLPYSCLKVYASCPQKPPTELPTCVGLVGEDVLKHCMGLWFLLKPGVFCHWLQRVKEWKSFREDNSYYFLKSHLHRQRSIVTVENKLSCWQKLSWRHYLSKCISSHLQNFPLFHSSSTRLCGALISLPRSLPSLMFITPQNLKNALSPLYKSTYIKC